MSDIVCFMGGGANRFRSEIGDTLDERGDDLPFKALGCLGQLD